MAACPTGKLGYTSADSARRSKGLRRNKGHRMRAYLCPLCHDWHLTTQPSGGTR
jgi:hypothetical protein